MSLRADFHAAFDEVAPSTRGLSQRVVQTTLAEAPERGRKQRWMFRMRAPMSMVAALLLIAMAAGALVGVSLLRDWRHWSTANPPQVNQTMLKSLEARPLQLPVVAIDAKCPTSALTDVSGHGPESFMFGNGPVYSSPLGFNLTTTDWGTWGSFDLKVDTTKTSGLILVRAQDLQTNMGAVFALFPSSAPGAAGDGIPAGRRVGHDVILGVSEQLYAEEVIDTSRPYSGTKKGEWPIFKSFMGYPKAAAGCIGFQIDGGNFMEMVVVSA